MENNIKVREELLEAIDGLTDEQINKIVFEGKWTISQVLEHLYLTEKVIVRNLSQAQTITEDIPVKLKNVQVVVDRTQKFNAPNFLVPTSEYQTLDQLKAKLVSSRDMLKNYLENIDVKELNEKFLLHPFLGKLRLGQWVEFLFYHEKRHISQIEELKEELNR